MAQAQNSRRLQWQEEGDHPLGERDSPQEGGRLQESSEKRPNSSGKRGDLTHGLSMRDDLAGKFK